MKHDRGKKEGCAIHHKRGNNNSQELFEEMMEHGLPILQQAKTPWGSKETMISFYHQLISHPIEDLLVVKEKIQDLIDNRVVTSPPKLMKAPVNPVAVRRGSFEGNYLKAPATKN